MKKITKRFIVLAFIVLSFLIGMWIARQSSEQKNAAVTEPTLLSGEDETGSEPADMKPGTVHISARGQQMIGMKVGTVRKEPVSHTLRVLGRVAADEVKIYRIIASVDGWIQEAYDNSIGTFVKKDEVLATFYSPAFLDTQQAYIYALDAADRLVKEKRLELGRQEFPAQIALDQLNVQRQIDILRSYGMSDRQLEEIGRTRQISLKIEILSPESGFVLARNVSPGQRFLKGTELFQIADLSSVWILADVFEHEVHYFKPGMTARVYFPAQEISFEARVTKILPIFDAETRSLQVRLETANPDFILKPDMFGDVELPIQLEPAITVPMGAIIYSGSGKTVFVDRGNGYFEPRKVDTGWRLGDRVEIVSGLMPGERIVLSGNFFVDSESRLQAAAMGMYGETSEDPVCGMDVDQIKAIATKLTSTYKGKTYYFCSQECKEEFDADPGRYTQGSPKQ